MSRVSSFMSGLRRTKVRVNSWPASRFLRSGISLFNYRRCFGFASEGAFWLIFTLPFLIIGFLSASAWAAEITGSNILTDVEELIIDNANRLLTPEAVDEQLIPFLQSVSNGRGGLTLVGLGSALYSGSRVFATLTQGARALRGMPLKGYLVNRGIAMILYVVGLVMLVGVVVSTLLMPGLNSRLLTDNFTSQWVGFVTTVLALALVATVMLYLVNPRRQRFRDEIPGGILAVIAWLVGSAGLQIYLAWIIGSGSVYGAISSLVAIFIWALIFTVAAFAGMTLNITISYSRRGVFLTRDLMMEADADAYQLLLDRAADEDSRVSQLRAITETSDAVRKSVERSKEALDVANAAAIRADAAVKSATSATAAAEKSVASIPGRSDEIEDAATESATDTAEVEQAAATAIAAANQANDCYNETQAAAAATERQSSSAVRQESLQSLQSIKETVERDAATAEQASRRSVQAARDAEDAADTADEWERKSRQAAAHAADLARKILSDKNGRSSGSHRGDDSGYTDGATSNVTQ